MSERQGSEGDGDGFHVTRPACRSQGPDSIQKCDVGKQASKWRPYLDMLPRNFSAPLFWSDEEVEELKGSQVMIGRGFRVKDWGGWGAQGQPGDDGQGGND